MSSALARQGSSLALPPLAPGLPVAVSMPKSSD
jgi:hypothetical protein